MRVRVFSTGRVRPRAARRGIGRYLGGPWADTTLPVNVFLFEHPEGYCLVDAGQEVAAARPGYFPRWHPFFRLSRFELSAEEPAAAQLRAAGIGPEQVRWLVLTHLHTDHVGGVADFPNAELVVARREWEDATGLRGRLRGYLPQYRPPWARPTLIDFDGPPHGPFTASHDLAGDGRLILLPLPGHTRGHMAVLVRGIAPRTCLCVGDAAHSAAELATTAPRVAEWCLQHGLVVLASHDDGAAGALRD